MDLSGKTALVAGATRGTGRGIARALGEAGATVYCTGRTTRHHQSPMGRAETIDDTAEMVTAAGGRGIAVRVDHTDTHQVRALANDIGHLDILVNDIWGGDPHIAWGQPFWKQDPDVTWGVLENALRTHLTTAAIFAPALRKSHGLLVEVTDGDTYRYRGNLLYDLVKTTVIRAAYGMAQDLGDDATAVAVTPGFLRSEAMLELFGVREENWRDGVAKDPNFVASETPLFVGRGIAALAADPARHRFAGRVVASWVLGDQYGVRDADGTQPHWGRHFEATYGDMGALDDAFYAYWKPFDLTPDAEASK